MKITVNEQTQRFYLALERWEPAIGHEIKVGKYKFCAIPLSGYINVSEVTSGCKVFNIPMDLAIMLDTESKESTMNFFYRVGESLKRIIGTRDSFDAELAGMRKIAFERLGDMPPIEDVNLDCMFEDASDVLN